jgi:hypothetical protein
VKNEAGFLAYNPTVTSLSLLGQYELSKHHHRRLAELAQAINIGIIARTDVHNYQLADSTPHSNGLRLIGAGK